MENMDEGMDVKKRHRINFYELNKGTRCGRPRGVWTISSVGQNAFENILLRLVPYMQKEVTEMTQSILKRVAPTDSSFNTPCQPLIKELGRKTID